MKAKRPAAWSILPVVGLALVAAFGIFQAFESGSGKDFSVFHEAWGLVLSGHGSEIYHATKTDRFLYAPGFAWLLSPLALFSRNVALAIWCLFKAYVLGFVIRALGERLSPRGAGLGIAAAGALLVARPLLIDFRYGQVNLFILGACVWALLGHFSREKPSGNDAIRWFVLAIAAMTKLFALPLLLVPWVVLSGIPERRLKYERVAVVSGVLLMILLPMVSLGVRGTLGIHFAWRDALIAKGLPIVSHNQSFTALLLHYFSGNATPIVAEHRRISLGFAWLSHETIMILALAWALVTFGLALGWIFSGSKQAPLKWIAVSIGLLFVPSHLVWKPYFVLSMPLAILLVSHAVQGLSGARGRRVPWECFLVVAVFVAFNFTGFDFVGQDLSAHFEAASLFLIVHFVLLAAVLFSRGNAALNHA